MMGEGWALVFVCRIMGINVKKPTVSLGGLGGAGGLGAPVPGGRGRRGTERGA